MVTVDSETGVSVSGRLYAYEPESEHSIPGKLENKLTVDQFCEEVRRETDASCMGAGFSPHSAEALAASCYVGGGMAS